METNVAENKVEAAQVHNALERRLDLTVAVADLEKEVGLQLKRIGKTLKLPGFRPGKVPEKIVRQQYAGQAYHDALNAALEKAFGETVNAQNLRVAGYPKIEQKKTENTENETHLEFSAVFEVFPEVKPGDLADVEIKRPVLDVGEAELGKTLDILRKQRIQYNLVDRPVAMGDQVKLDFFGKKDGESFPGGDSKDAVFVVGEGVMLPEFEKAIIGLKAGETRSSEVTFPEKYFAKELAGQTVVFDIALKEVHEAKLPELNDEFAKALGIGDGDVNRMRAEIEANLKREVSKRLRDKVKEQVMDALLKATPLDIPNALIEMETQGMMEAAVEDLQRRGGVEIKNLPIKPEWFTEKAKRRVGLGLILSELVKIHDLKARPEQVKSIVEETAQSYEKPEEVVRWYYAQPKNLADIEGIVIENNVVEWALSKAKVVDQTIDFDELMGQKPQPFTSPATVVAP